MFRNIIEKTRKESRESEINALTRGANYTDNILAVSPQRRITTGRKRCATAAKGNNAAVFYLGDIRSLVELNTIAAFR